MECRPLEITVVSGKDLKDVNVFGKMDVYCVASIKGDPSKQKQKTHVHKDCGPNPIWNFPMKFTIDEAAAQQNRLTIKLKLKAERMMGDKAVGVVWVPVKELLDAKDGKGGLLSYAVKTPSGKMKGTLSFSVKFGDKFNVPAPEKAKKMDEHVAAAYPAMGYHASAGKKTDEPVTAYPAPGYQGAPASSSAYPAPPPHAAGDKHQAPYPYPYQYPPPPQQGYGGYPPAPGHGYPGYPQQPGYGGYPPQPGYGGYPPVMQPQKPKKSGKGNMALGLGAGLLGGLLVGDMISDVGEMSSYDAGFSDGLDF